jgi:hypothetical protein
MAKIYSTGSFGASTISGTTIGTTIYSNGSSNIAYNYDLVDRNEKLKDFIEFSLQLMGIDLTFDEFKNMSEIEKKTFIRDYKLEKLLKNKED